MDALIISSITKPGSLLFPIDGGWWLRVGSWMVSESELVMVVVGGVAVEKEMVELDDPRPSKTVAASTVSLISRCE